MSSGPLLSRAPLPILRTSLLGNHLSQRLCRGWHTRL